MPADGSTAQEGVAARSFALRAKAGDAEAFAELFASHRADVMRLCTRLIGREEAEDAAQEVFLRARNRIESFDAAHPFRPWLLAIGSNHCIDRLRRRSTERLLFEPGDVEAKDSTTPQATALDGVLSGQDREILLTALDGLPDHYRAPLVLRYFADLDYDAIGAELGISRAQVGTLLFRAKSRLRALLGADHLEGPQ